MTPEARARRNAKPKVLVLLTGRALTPARLYLAADICKRAAREDRNLGDRHGSAALYEAAARLEAKALVAQVLAEQPLGPPKKKARR